MALGAALDADEEVFFGFGHGGVREVFLRMCKLSARREYR